MGTEDQVLLKLIITGMDPAEVSRLAQMTGGQLNAEMKPHIDRLVQLHKDANAAVTADAVKRVKAEMDAEEMNIEQIAKVARAHEIAANRASGAWHRTMEDLENITTVARGAFDVMMGGWERFKELGDSITKVSNVYGSLRGSIDEMREASHGQISDFDLITTKNRALEKDLNLTDEQFGLVAASAEHFAHALGTDTKEALSQLIDGLATGRTKMLSHAGVVIDTERVYSAYAHTLGTTSDKLTDHAKKIALTEAALRAMDEKVAEAGPHTDNFASRWEQLSAQIENFKDKVLLPLGEFIFGAVHGLTVELPEAVGLMIAKMEDIVSFGHAGGLAKAQADHQARLAQELADENAAATRAQARLASGSAYRQIAGSRESLVKPTKTDYEPDIMHSEYGAKRAGQGLDELMSAAADPNVSIDQFIKSREAIEKAEDDHQKALRKSAAKAAEAMAKTLEEVMNRTQGLKETADRAGGGLIARLVFGPDGPSQLYEEMDYFQQHAVDMFGSVADAGMKMADASGASLAASLAGDDAHRKSMRQVTHDMLESLAAQALSRAIFETAEGLASLALGPIGGVPAGMHFAAAAMFGSVGVTAGVGARAFAGSSAPSSAPHSSGSGIVSRGSQFGGSSSQSGSGSPQTTSIVINQTILPGGEAEAGRAVMRSLNALHQQTGQLPFLANAS